MPRSTAFRILNVVDEFTHESVGLLIERNIGSRRVERFLGELFCGSMTGIRRWCLRVGVDGLSDTGRKWSTLR